MLPERTHIIFIGRRVKPLQQTKRSLIQPYRFVMSLSRHREQTAGVFLPGGIIPERLGGYETANQPAHHLPVAKEKKRVRRIFTREGEDSDELMDMAPTVKVYHSACPLSE